MDAVIRELRPQPGRVLHAGLTLAPIFVAAWGIGTALDPDKVSLVRAVTTGLGCSAVMTTLLAASYFWECRTSWRVGPDGVAVCRGGRPTREVPWSEVRSLVVLQYGAALLTAGRPKREWLYWLGHADGRWLREYAATRL